MEKNNKEMNRRKFMKLLGAGAAVTSAALYGCQSRQDASSASQGVVPTDKMTYRTNPSTGDKVSLLGFGMMRLPSVRGRSAREGNEGID